MREELLEGKSRGADGTVSDSGWSNSEVFRGYVENHLLKYLPERSVTNPVLLLYDGHRSHINVGIIDLAKQQNIILFVLPAHTSHVLQPLDVGCFGPFERIFNNMSHTFMRDNCGMSITRYNICSVACPAYCKALSQENLQSSFKRSGIYPFNPNAVDPSHFKPAEVLEQDQSSCSPETVPNVVVDDTVATAPVAPADADVVSEVVQNEHTPQQFFAVKQKVLTEKKPQTKKRKYLSTIISGKPVTEDHMVSAIKAHEANKKPRSKAQSQKPKSTGKSPTNSKHKSGGKSKTKTVSKQNAKPEPTPGPSGLCRPINNLITSDESSSEDEDNTKCCVCGKFTPDEVRRSHSVIFTKWVACDGCSHWTHLIYCTKVRVIRRGDSFLCMHCAPEE